MGFSTMAAEADVPVRAWGWRLPGQFGAGPKAAPAENEQPDLSAQLACIAARHLLGNRCLLFGDSDLPALSDMTRSFSVQLRVISLGFKA